MGQIPTTPAIIPVPFAANGQKNSIPETVDTPGAPNASWSAGFPSITMINRQAGGKPPLGMDFNGVLNQLSSNAFFAQSGGLYPWDAALDYLTNAHVQGSDGEEYIAVAPSGPDVPAAGSGFVGAQDPTTDTANAYWISASAKFGAPIATQSVRGIARLATTLEVKNGQSSPDAPAPAVLDVNNARSLPKATDALFGLGRSATAAEAAAGATSGTGPAWVTPEELATGLAGKTDGKVTLLGTRTTTGNWSITNVKVRKPLYILADLADNQHSGARLYLVSGGVGGKFNSTSYDSFVLGRYADPGPDVFVTIPSASTVVLNVWNIEGSLTMYAYQ